jgi:hypothetical protein
VGGHRARGEGAAEALGELVGALEVGLREQDGELLAAVASGEVDLAHGRPQDVGERLEDLIAGLVAVVVVHLLEVVEVGEDRAGSRRSAPPEILPERLLEVAAVRGPVSPSVFAWRRPGGAGGRSRRSTCEPSQWAAAASSLKSASRGVR